MSQRGSAAFHGGYFFHLLLGLVIVGIIGILGYMQMQKDYEQAQLANERHFKKLNISMASFDQNQILKLTPILQNYTADYCDPRSKNSASQTSERCRICSTCRSARQ